MATHCDCDCSLYILVVYFTTTKNTTLLIASDGEQTLAMSVHLTIFVVFT